MREVRRRRVFLIASFLIGAAFGIANFFSSFWQTYTYWLAGLFLGGFAFAIVYFLFARELRGWKESLAVTILPSLLALSFSWFAPLLPSSFFWRLILFLIFTAGYYLVLLTENLFVVSSRFKTVPLYRAAFVTSFAFTLLAGFLVFAAIFSLKFSPWLNGLLVALVSFFLFYHLFWSVSIAEEKAEFLSFALTAAFLVGEMALVISFWPLTTSLASLYLVSWVYVLGSIFQYQLRQRLFTKTLKEFILIGAVAFLALLSYSG